MSLSFSLSSRVVAELRVTLSNASLSRLLVFRASNSLEAVILLVQPSSAAIVDEHVQEHHRFLSFSLSLARAPGATRLFVLHYPLS